MLALRLCLGVGAELGRSHTVAGLHASFYCDGKQWDPASGMRHCRCTDCCITTVTASEVAWDPHVSVSRLWCVTGSGSGSLMSWQTAQHDRCLSFSTNEVEEKESDTFINIDTVHTLYLYF